MRLGVFGARFFPKSNLRLSYGLSQVNHISSNFSSDHWKKLLRRSGFFSAKDKVYEGKSNDKQSKCSSSSIYKLIDLLQTHVDFLSKIIPRYREIITARIYHVKSKREVENGTAKNQTTEVLAQKAAYILKAGFENRRLIRNYNNRFSLTMCQ